MEKFYDYLQLGLPIGTRIYLAGPYTNEDRAKVLTNVGRLYTYFYLLMARYNVTCLPLMTCGMDVTKLHQELTPDDWLATCEALIDTCSQLCAVPDWQGSVGTRREMDYFVTTKQRPVICIGLTEALKYKLQQEFIEHHDDLPLASHALRYLEKLYF